MAKPRSKRDQVFVKDGRRSYRRHYSVREVRIGASLVLALAAVAAWVIWKGRHPDPELYEIDLALLEAGAAGATAAEVGRGPLPDGLAGPGWHEGSVSSFDASNLYVKINGREDYYKSFGFQRLWFLSLIDDEDPTRVVDIELFDLGSAPNALGAYAGERPEEVAPRVDDRGMAHRARNALMMTRGRYYVRAIGADESSAVLAQLDHLEKVLGDGLEGEPLPWAYALFVGGMQLDPSRVAYAAENAFSFGFARRVWSATVDDAGTEAFVVAVPDSGAAAALAARFREGFETYGERLETAGTPDGVTYWIRDRYQGLLAAAAACGPWVLGVRGAPDATVAGTVIRRLADAVQALPIAVREQARAAALVDSGEPAATRRQAQEADASPAGAESGYPVEP